MVRLHRLCSPPVINALFLEYSTYLHAYCICRKSKLIILFCAVLLRVLTVLQAFFFLIKMCKL